MADRSPGPQPGPPATSNPGRRRFDPLGLWLCGLGVLGLARAWLYLVREAATYDPVAWTWLGGSLLMAGIGIALLARGLRRPTRR